MRGNHLIRAAMVALIVLVSVGGAWAGRDKAQRRIRPTLDELTARLEVEHRPNGVILEKRSFEHAVPWDEYLAALAAEQEETLPGVSTESLLLEPLVPTGVCIPPDDDYDGDGFTLSTPTPDTFPLRRGEYVADRPMVVSEFVSYIEPGIDVLYSGSNTTTYEGTRYLKDDLIVIEKIFELREIKKSFNGKLGLKLGFGLKGLVPSFSLDLTGESNWTLDKRWEYKWTRDTTHTTQSRFEETRTLNETGGLTIEPHAGRVTGIVEVRNESDYALDMQVSNVRVAVVAYSPYTGFKHAVGDVLMTGTPVLGYGAGNNFYRETLTLSGLNSLDILDALAEGWVFDMEVSGGYTATNTANGESVTALISTVNQRNARISIHYGDGNARDFGQVSVFQPNQECLTAKAMLETYVGAENVEFDRMEDGTLVVKRINHRENRHADRDFDTLTPQEQSEYGRWIVGYRFYNQPITAFDLETTLLAPEDLVSFYYLTAEDFIEEIGPPDDTAAFAVANDGTSPSEMLAVQAVNTNDLVEIDVSNEFEIREPYTQFQGNIWNANCGTVLSATWHGHRVKYTSLNDSITIPDVDWYGVQVKFGGLGWMTMGDLLNHPDADAQLLTFREYPWYDYALQFRAAPSLLGDYPTRNLQVKSSNPRQTFTVGYTGYNILGQSIQCFWQQTAGYHHNSGSVKVWYQLANTDLDLDTFPDQARTGLDFDDANDRRFPMAPEHLDGIDNNGDTISDNSPMRCPQGLLSGQQGTCVLDDSMDWYGSNPNLYMEKRWHKTDGSTTAWQSIGNTETHTFSMSSDPADEALEIRLTHYPAGGGSFTGSNMIYHAPDGDIPLYDVGEMIEAEDGHLVWPMRAETSGSDTFVHVPVGTAVPGTASASYRIRILQDDDYYIWTRVFANNSGDDSFLVRVLDSTGQPVSFGPATQAHFRLEFSIPDYAHGSWGWTLVGHYNAYVSPVENVNPIPWHLTPGVYTIEVRPRELGTKLDILQVENDCPDLDGDGWTTCAGDCDDLNAGVYPGRGEVCSNSRDDDCDGYVNEGCGGGCKPPKCVIRVEDAID